MLLAQTFSTMQTQFQLGQISNYLKLLGTTCKVKRPGLVIVSGYVVLLLVKHVTVQEGDWRGSCIRPSNRNVDFEEILPLTADQI